MSDNSFGTTFGPSSPGAINLVSGDTGGVDMTHTANSPSIATAAKPDADLTPDGQGDYSMTSDPQPFWDDCSTRDAVAMSGQNIGDRLNTAGLSWGFFQGGYRPTTSYTDALATTGNWNLKPVSGSFDSVAGSLNGLLDLAKPHGEPRTSAPCCLTPRPGSPPASIPMGIKCLLPRTRHPGGRDRCSMGRHL